MDGSSVAAAKMTPRTLPCGSIIGPPEISPGDVRHVKSSGTPRPRKPSAGLAPRSSAAPSATCRPAPRSGTRSSTGCSPQITMNWRGRPLTSHHAIVNLIANTSTVTGLVVQCVLDTGPTRPGIRYTDKDVAALPLVRHEFHGDWNYSLSLVQVELRIAQPCSRSATRATEPRAVHRRPRTESGALRGFRLKHAGKGY